MNGQETDGSTDQAPIEVESLCPRCEKNGTTKLLMLDIPHFRQIVLMVSFSVKRAHRWLGAPRSTAQSNTKARLPLSRASLSSFPPCRLSSARTATSETAKFSSPD